MQSNDGNYMGENRQELGERSESLDLDAVLSQCVAHLACRQAQYPSSFGLNPSRPLHGIDQALAFSSVIRANRNFRGLGVVDDLIGNNA
jgi:hypothetical protein